MEMKVVLHLRQHRESAASGTTNYSIVLTADNRKNEDAQVVVEQ